MSIDLVRFCFISLLMKPTAVVLSTCAGVGGCGWLSSMRVFLIGMASWQLMYADAISTSAAELIKFLSILHTTWMAPLRIAWFGWMGLPLRKKNPPDLLRDLGADR